MRTLYECAQIWRNVYTNVFYKISFYLQLLRVDRVSAALSTAAEAAAFDATDASTASEATETTIDSKYRHDTRLEST